MTLPPAAVAVAVQCEDVGHEMSPTAVTVEGSVCAVQVAPPSVVAITVAPADVVPVAKQSDVSAQEIARRPTTPLAGLWAVQVDPGVSGGDDHGRCPQCSSRRRRSPTPSGR